MDKSLPRGRLLLCVDVCMTMRKIVLVLCLVWATVGLRSQEVWDSVGCLKDARVAIVLSGGGALGYAHIGALQALDEAGVRPCFIAGTSMGAIVGVFYAQGYSGDEIYGFVKERRLYNIFRNVDVSARNANRGVGSYRRVRRLINDAIPHDCFDSLRVPFLCVATDLSSNEAEVRSGGGRLADWVLASASIPVLFKPQLIEGGYYCDGGFVDNLPACHVPRGCCDVCVGIDVTPSVLPPTGDFFSLRYGMEDVYGNMILDVNSREGRGCCDVVIRPHGDVRYGILDFRDYELLRKRGYDAMREWLEGAGMVGER